MELVFGWRRRKEVLCSFYDSQFCSIHCAIVTFWTYSWWVWPTLWMLRLLGILTSPFVSWSATAGCHVIVLHWFPFHSSSVECTLRVRDWERSALQGVKQEQNRMPCCLKECLHWFLHVRVSEGQDVEVAHPVTLPWFLCVSWCNSGGRVLLACFPEALLSLGVITSTSLNTPPCLGRGSEGQMFLSSHFNKLIFQN